MSKAIRNIIKAPLVLLVRLPVMVILGALVWVGESAERCLDRASELLPGFER